MIMHVSLNLITKENSEFYGLGTIPSSKSTINSTFCRMYCENRGENPNIELAGTLCYSLQSDAKLQGDTAISSLPEVECSTMGGLPLCPQNLDCCRRSDLCNRCRLS